MKTHPEVQRNTHYLAGAISLLYLLSKFTILEMPRKMSAYAAVKVSRVLDKHSSRFRKNRMYVPSEVESQDVFRAAKFGL